MISATTQAIVIDALKEKIEAQTSLLASQRDLIQRLKTSLSYAGSAGAYLQMRRIP